MANENVRTDMRRRRDAPLMEARAAYQAALEDVKRCARTLLVHQVRIALTNANIAGHAAILEDVDG